MERKLYEDLCEDVLTAVLPELNIRHEVWDLKVYVARALPSVVLEEGVDKGVVIYRETNGETEVCGWDEIVDVTGDSIYKYGLHTREKLRCYDMQCLLWVQFNESHPDFVHSALSSDFATVMASFLDSRFGRGCFHWWRQSSEIALDFGIGTLDVFRARFLENIFGLCRWDSRYHYLHKHTMSEQNTVFELVTELTPGWEFVRDEDQHGAEVQVGGPNGTTHSFVDLGANTISEIISKYAGRGSYHDMFQQTLDRFGGHDNFTQDEAEFMGLVESLARPGVSAGEIGNQEPHHVKAFFMTPDHHPDRVFQGEDLGFPRVVERACEEGSLNLAIFFEHSGNYHVIVTSSSLKTATASSAISTTGVKVLYKDQFAPWLQNAVKKNPSSGLSRQQIRRRPAPPDSWYYDIVSGTPDSSYHHVVVKDFQDHVWPRGLRNQLVADQGGDKVLGRA